MGIDIVHTAFRYLVAREQEGAAGVEEARGVREDAIFSVLGIGGVEQWWRAWLDVWGRRTYHLTLDSD